MDMQAILAEVQGWPRASRLHLVEQIWDGLAEDELTGPADDAIRTMVRDRLARHEADPAAVLTWEEIVSHVRRPR